MHIGTTQGTVKLRAQWQRHSNNISRRSQRASHERRRNRDRAILLDGPEADRQPIAEEARTLAQPDATLTAHYDEDIRVETPAHAETTYKSALHDHLQLWIETQTLAVIQRELTQDT